ncbi:MipA/OmpV family protein [Altererythrobacter sp. H2]|uniref:MipA/OmpV family protein n=1 Tax=Altererythrobacter sp. H2 TaxID=3108391 RepID=UPI002B4BD246|nr:MipA/OmpV family protein [Altererythrobacter sp. H2]WRK95493.1 MipA/OmpV family protein [Altererythrobacter sp. H2]
MRIIFGSLALLASPALAQEAPQGPPAGIPPPGETVFDDTWVTIGVGAAYSPSYSGSDDYRLAVLPVVQGKVAGVRVEPRPAGLALNVLPEVRGKPSLSFGPVIRVRSDRADDIEDPVVELAGELDRAVEVGATAGLNIPGVLTRFDTLSFTVDLRQDVAGAHSGMVVEPRVSWGSPLSRAAFVQLSAGAEFVSNDYARYYQSVSPAQAAASGLPQFAADGGLNALGANLLVGYDLDGNALNGGLGLVMIAAYSRLQGDAARTPYTSLRGDADQALVVLGIGYTF